MNRAPNPDALHAAVARALERGDERGALQAIAEGWQELAIEHGHRLRAIIGMLPAASWAGEPVIGVALGASYRTAPDGAAAALTYLEAAHDAARAHGAGAMVEVDAALQLAAALRRSGEIDRAAAVLEQAEELVEHSPEAPIPWRVHARAALALQLGIVAQHRGRLPDAENRLRRADGLADPHLVLAERVEARGALALCELNLGELDAAGALAAAARSLAADGPPLDTGFGAPALLAELGVAIDRFATPHAAALLPRALSAAAGTEWEPLSLEFAARLALVEGRYVESLDLLRRASAQLERWHGQRLWTALGGMMRAQVLIRVGQGDAAWSILTAVPSDPRHDACSERFIAELRLLNGDVEGAADALGACERLGDRHSPRTLIEVQLLRAAIELERNSLTASDLWADRALLSMSRSSSLMPLLFLPDPALDRLRDRALERRQPAAVRELLERIALHPRPGAVPAQEQLTGREAAVLERLRRGDTIAGAAAALYLSTNTVKTHLRNVYRKLGVSSRDEAVRKAAALGLYLGAGARSGGSSGGS